LGTCNGEASLDCFGVCNGEAVMGCDDVCDSGLVYDCMGTCDGDAIEDCMGGCNGVADYDENGDCICTTYDSNNICLSTVDSMPREFMVDNLSPNPFNPEVSIHYAIPEPGNRPLTSKMLISRLPGSGMA
jgi:hypothetical protein